MMEPIKPEPIEPAGDEPQARLHSLADLLSAIEADADRRNIAHKEKRLLGPITGLNELDKMLGRYLAPGVHIVHGDPGAGKTAFALQIAADCGFPALYVSAEMPMIELARRITARLSQTYLGRFKSGEMPASQASALAKKAFDQCPGLHLMDATSGPARLDFIEKSASLIMERQQADSMLIVVDSAHSWASGLRADESEYEVLSEALAQLRKLASRLACPVITIAERNRANRKQAGMDAAAGTRAFEYGAETVISLGEPEPKEPEPTPGEKRINAVIQKNRHDAAGGHAALAFHGALQKFREV
jgi:replicative DNA helicase